MDRREELRTAAGLLLLAAAAWALPPLRSALLRPRAAPATEIYAHASDSRLFWSPHAPELGSSGGPTAASPAAPHAPTAGGWTGLLLGYPLDLNRATAEDLAALPGIGPRKAAAILAYREENGRFEDPSELLAIRGIGPKTLAAIEPLVRVDASLHPR